MLLDISLTQIILQSLEQNVWVLPVRMLFHVPFDNSFTATRLPPRLTRSFWRNYLLQATYASSDYNKLAALVHSMNPVPVSQGSRQG